MKKLLSLFLLGALPLGIFAQIVKPVHWKFEYRATQNNRAELICTANIEKGWHIYGLDLRGEGPKPTSFHFTNVKDILPDGNVKPEHNPEIEHDPGFDMDVSMFSGKVTFIQKLKITGTRPVVKGYVEYMSCNNVNCLPPKREEFNISGTAQASTIPKTTTADTTATDTVKNTVTVSSLTNGNETASAEKPAEAQGWFMFLLVAFLAGLAGVLTPCVFPMIPMTVSFFMNNNKGRTNGIVKALVFGFSLVLIYTLIGGLVSLIGSGFVDFLTKHWIPNLIFFTLFVVFSLSFLGLFEIIIPGNIVNKADQQVEKGGMLASFFMALTTALVSFSCTGPIVGSLLVEGASGHVLRPLLGMLSFGAGFALPFTILALFPSLLKNLPKSGGWMNSVKVVLGLIMLALSLKFIMNIDQTHHLGILTRNVYIVIWMVITMVMGFYLLGKIRTTHDSEVKTVGVGRLLIAIGVFSFAGYLFTGLLGSPLENISSFLPPQSRNQSSLTVSHTENTPSALCEVPKYSNFLELPFGLNGYFDYKQGMTCARKLNKPVLLDFKGHTCSNCKKMENSVWSDAGILQQLNSNFVIIALYTDDYTKLPENEWVKSSFDGETKKTIGELNADLQATRFKTNTAPMYVIVDTTGKMLAGPVGYDPDIRKFNNFLQKGMQLYSKK